MVTTAEFDNICPRCIVRNTDSEDDSGNLLIKLSKKTANLKRIEYNVPESIFLRLLLCKENKKASKPDDCPCPEYENKKANNIICKSKENLAHIYFGYEHPEKVCDGILNCIIIFSRNNLNTDELIQRLRATITQLGIEKENFCLYVIRYKFGNITVNKPNINKIKKNYAYSKIYINPSINMDETNDRLILKIGQKPDTKYFSITGNKEKIESG